MATMSSSLVSSIFGVAGTQKDEKLTGLFGSSKDFPKRNFTEVAVERKRKPQKDEASEEESADSAEINSKKKLRKDDACVEKNDEESGSGDDSDSSSSSDSESSHNDSTEEEEKDEPMDTAIEEVADEVAEDKETPQNGKDNVDRTIFVGNLPPSTNRKSLASMFKPCGKVESARLRSMAVEGVKLPPHKAGDQNLMRKVCVNTNKLKDDAPKKTVQGYVVFKSPDSVKKALEMNNKEIKSEGLTLRLRVDKAQPSNDSTRSVFVGNLPYGADEASLRQHFVRGCEMNDGDIEGVRIIRDHETLQCKGFGYVLLRDKSLVAAALRMHESEYMRRQLRVMVCGKRFKGRRGKEGSPTDGGVTARKFEGRRATPNVSKGAARRVVGKMKRKHPHSSTAALLKSSSGGKKKRMRGAPATKKIDGGARKAGVSKRAAAEAKLGKRVKKIQKRISKGMGKAK